MNFYRIYYKIDDSDYSILPEEYYQNDEINVNKFILDNDIEEESKIKLLYVGTIFTLSAIESSDNNIEHRVQMEGNSLESFYDIRNRNTFGIIDQSSYSSITAIERDTLDRTMIFRLSDPIELDGTFQIFELKGSSEFIVSKNVKEDGESDLIFLKGSRRDSELDKFFNEKTEKKSYGSVKTQFDGLTEQAYKESIEEYNIDFSNFDNHVFFGSAKYKIDNAVKKLDIIEQYNQNINILDPSAESSIKRNEEKIRNIIDTLTDFERYVYDLKKSLSMSEFDDKVNTLYEESDLYDSTNNNFILYSIPDYFITNDTDGLLTNFLLVIGEFMDSIWTRIRIFENVYNFDITSNEMISDKFIDTMLLDLGLDVDYKYTEKDITDYFSSDRNIKKISQQISKRLLYSLPYLNKSKGTSASLKQILNVFGISPNLFQIYEFGYVDKENESFRSIFENDWYVNITNESATIDVADTDLDWDDFTLEVSVRNLKGTGNLFYFTDNDRIEFIENDGSVSLIWHQNGVENLFADVFKSNDVWKNIVIRKNNLDGRVNIYSMNDIDNKNELINTHDIILQTGSPTFSEVSMSGDFELTSIRMFNSYLSDEVVDYHKYDFNNVSEEGDNDTLLAFFPIYKPDSTPITLDSEVNSYVFSFTGDQNDFNKYEFTLSYIDNNSMSGMFSSDKIDFYETEKIQELSKDRIATKLDEVDNIFDLPFIGIFISPTDMFDKHIHRLIGFENDFIMDDNTEYDYVFSNLSEKRFVKDRIRYNYFKESTLYRLISLFNNKVYNVLSEFKPASSTLLTGLLIKNSILDKNKEVKRGHSLTTRKTPQIDFKDNFKNLASTSTSLKGLIEYSANISSVDSDEVKEIIITSFDGSRSKFIIPIESYKDRFKRSPWLNRMIKGNNKNTRYLSAEDIEELLNKGARILVR